jgi:hypothetical protein
MGQWKITPTFHGKQNEIIAFTKISIDVQTLRRCDLIDRKKYQIILNDYYFK